MYGSGAYVRLHGREQLFDAVHVVVHLADGVQMVVEVGRRSEESLPSVQGAVQDELSRLLLGYARELGLERDSGLAE